VYLKTLGYIGILSEIVVLPCYL